MKTLTTAAKAAIVAGEAIVTGAVAITPTAALVPAEIAAGTAVALDWVQATFDQTITGSPPGTPNDEARMGVAFLDVVGGQIGATTWATLIAPTPPMVFQARSLSTVTPAGACSIRFLMEMNRRTGTNNDGYIDEITASVGGTPVALVNPGAEDGTAGWIVETGAINTRSASPLAPSGASYFMGGTKALSRAHQDYATYSSVTPDPIFVWGGFGPLTIAGNVFQGVGDRGLAQQGSGAIGGVAQGMTLGLSGIEPEALALLDDAATLKGAATVIYRLIFGPDGKTLLDAHVFDRGRLDTLDSEAEVGAGAAIIAAIESTARSLGRSLARLRSDSDQRTISSSDGYFQQTGYAWQKELYWGGKKPARSATAVGGSTATASGSGGVASAA
jgi:hypothetical protein